MSEGTVVFETQPGYALIRLNRPEVHNAVNSAVMGRLEEIQNAVRRRKDINVLILTGTGTQSFCAGGDIQYFATLKNRDQALGMSRRMQAVLNGFRSGDQVVIAAVNGSAFGGGCEILTACHYRIASDQARFSFRQAANGLITGWGGGVRLFTQIASSKALRLLLTSETIDSRCAASMGLIDEVVPGYRVLDAAIALSRSISGNSPEAVRAFLRIYQKVLEDRRKAAALETERFGDLWIGDDFKRWLKKFLKSPAGEQSE